jgi:glucan biosynthesis protein C
VVGAVIARCSIAGDARMTNSIKRHGWVCLATWVLPWVVVGGLFTLVLQYDPEPGHGFSLLYVLWRITWNVIRWSSMVFLLSVGAKYLNFTNKLLAYANEAVLPFFLFHQTVILIVGWYVLTLPIANLPKFLIIVVVSFPAIMILYEVFVRHIAFMRFLFGMAPQKKHATAPGGQTS